MRRALSLPSVPFAVRKLPMRAIRRETKRAAMIVLGTVIAALGYSLFQVPFNIVAGGVNGLALIVNSLTGWSISVFYLLFNIPLLILGFKMLGRWQFLSTTVLAVFVYAFVAEIGVRWLPTVIQPFPVTDDTLLSGIYAGVVTGIGNGIVLRAGGTMGGTSVIGRIVQKYTGLPLSQSFLYADGTIIALSAFVFGWEAPLIALVALFISGIAADFVLEGPSVVRTLTIVTDNPEAVTSALMNGVNRGVSYWGVTGGYTGKQRSMVTCTINRFQVIEASRVIAEIDPYAFVVVGQSHQAFGGGFHKLKSDR